MANFLGNAIANFFNVAAFKGKILNQHLKSTKRRHIVDTKHTATTYSVIFCAKFCLLARSCQPISCRITVWNKRIRIRVTWRSATKLKTSTEKMPATNITSDAKVSSIPYDIESLYNSLLFSSREAFVLKKVEGFSTKGQIVLKKCYKSMLLF